MLSLSCGPGPRVTLLNSRATSGGGGAPPLGRGLPAAGSCARSPTVPLPVRAGDGTQAPACSPGAAPGRPRCDAWPRTSAMPSLPGLLVAGTSSGGAWQGPTSSREGGGAGLLPSAPRLSRGGEEPGQGTRECGRVRLPGEEVVLVLVGTPVFLEVDNVSFQPFPSPIFAVLARETLLNAAPGAGWRRPEAPCPRARLRGCGQSKARSCLRGTLRSRGTNKWTVMAVWPRGMGSEASTDHRGGQIK